LLHSEVTKKPLSFYCSLTQSVVYHDISYFLIDTLIIAELGYRKKRNMVRMNQITETYVKTFFTFKCIPAFKVNQVVTIE